ncbi:MAG TPA: diaminopimelate epimerase [bacterium]|nr:diaminopimelate epimerase [bacterium]
MQKLKFYKYQATGNDFVILDSRQLPENWYYSELATQICPRRTAIGADGLIIIENEVAEDFEMKYYNVDGSGPIMCGNGARASVQFVYQIIKKKEKYRFRAPDGVHYGKVQSGKVAITMQNTSEIQRLDDEKYQTFMLNTGAPHLVILHPDAENINIAEYAQPLREKYDANVNFVYKRELESWFIRTYERGVEDETLACGTGVTAAALVLTEKFQHDYPVNLQAKGGGLAVDFREEKLWLLGAAQLVYEGKIKINEL